MLLQIDVLHLSRGSLQALEEVPAECPELFFPQSPAAPGAPSRQRRHSRAAPSASPLRAPHVTAARRGEGHSARAGPNGTERDRREPSRAEPERAEPSRAGPNRSEPSGAGPGRTGASPASRAGSGAMSGPSEDERLRVQQLRALRRRWLRDQELSPREPVLPPRRLGPVAAFWERFVRPGDPWRLQVHKLYQTGSFVLLRVLLPAWAITYYLKYHVRKSPHGVVMTNPRIFPGDRILETGEIMPPLRDEHHQHH
uniref:NADH dehydrogenase [ubiquinone] 1 beta subcomplex subunit 6 n=2 Tax=Taeniopygia guttata TaxID=59729 RepID=A0A674HUM4_TAEGU